MRLFGLVCLVVSGCSFDHGVQRDDAAIVTSDAESDAGCASYSSLFDTCAIAMGTSDVTLTPGAWQYNTDTHLLTQGSIGLAVTSMVIDQPAGAFDVIFVSSFTVEAGATLRAIGPAARRPFGIVSTGAVRIDGVIDMTNDAAGARVDQMCGMQVGKGGETRLGGGSGGGGAGFHGTGGGGSNGNGDGTESTGGTGGTAVAARPPSPIGGCDGGRGGGGGASTNGGNGGDGGGAIYLASATSITVGATGVIDAGGHGGYEGGNNGDAGGGGGSGGMILLESKVVAIDGIVVANGGGGGEGNANGKRGEDGQRSTQRALGGKDGDANGGDGGDGGAGADLDGVTTTDVRDGGGGGGGGGVGFIAIACPSPAVTGTISPAFAPWP